MSGVSQEPQEITWDDVRESRPWLGYMLIIATVALTTLVLLLLGESYALDRVDARSEATGTQAEPVWWEDTLIKACPFH